MKNMIWKLMLSVLALCLPCVAQEVSFKDAPLGISLSEFIRKFDRPVENRSNRAPCLNFGVVFSVLTGEASNLYNFRQNGTIQVTKKFPFEEERINGLWANDTIAGVPARVVYRFNTMTLKDWDALAGGKKAGKEASQNWSSWSKDQTAIASDVLLGSVTVDFDSGYFNTVVDAISAKYGSPDSRDTVPFSDNTGARRKSDMAYWHIGEDVVICASNLDGYTTSSLVFTKTSVANRSAQVTREVSKDRASDL